MKRFMLFDLLSYYQANLSQIGDLLILHRYRKVRELLAIQHSTSVSDNQYRLVAEMSDVTRERVVSVVNLWIHRRPLRFLRDCRFPYVKTFISELTSRGKLATVLSDHPIGKKLHYLNLRQLKTFIPDSEEINCLKPNPARLIDTINRSGIAPERCLIIGNRDDRDGECARQAGLNYLLKGTRTRKRIFSSYKLLLEDLQST